MDHFFDQLTAAASTNPRITDLALLKAAFDFADTAHTGQLRKSGAPYISHAVETALLLIDWQMDITTVIAGLLHDTIEDGGATPEDLKTLFGPDIAMLVDGVTKVSHVKLKGSREDEFVENLRKMVLVMAKDLRVVFVKLADRLHNMRTIQYLAPDKQVGFAQETLEIYGPLADRLGMGEVSGELNDLAFQYSQPTEYGRLLTQTNAMFNQATVLVDHLKTQLTNELVKSIPAVQVSARKKRLYSLHCKLNRPEINHDLTKIHDLVAARIITDTVGQCYIALGIVHNLYRPVPYLGVSDFIANPKPNGYQSLHTKVFGPDGFILEIQIRTQAMHAQAEMGLAAHFQYAEAKSKGLSDARLESGNFAPNNKLTWVKQLLDWQHQLTDNKEYYEALKFDAFADRILVFSPIGDVYDLPQNATPVDFAFEVHSDLGYQTAGAKVNGKLVQLDYHLQNGDVVEIIPDRKKSRPNHAWLNFVATHRAKSEIEKFFRNQPSSA